MLNFLEVSRIHQSNNSDFFFLRFMVFYGTITYITNGNITNGTYGTISYIKCTWYS